MQIKGFSTFFGGILIHLVLGSFYLWGALSIYVASYFRIIYDPNLTTNIVLMILPCMAAFQGLTMPFSFKLATRIGYRLFSVICSSFLAIGIFLSSYVTNFWIFSIIYALVFGLMIGFLYIIPIFLCYEFFRKKKGIMGGFIIGAFGLGTFLSNFIAYALINPDNVQPIQGSDGNLYFNDDIALKVPQTIRYLAIYFFCLSFTGSIMLFNPRNTKIIPFNLRNYGQVMSVNSEKFKSANESKYQSFNDQQTMNGEEEQQDQSLQIQLIKKQEVQQDLSFQQGILLKNCESIRESLKFLDFYLIFFMIMFINAFGLMLTANYKNYGIQYIKDDKFLTVIGSVANLCNGFSRPIWGIMYDKLNFIKVFAIIIIFQTGVIIGLDFVVEYRMVFMLFVSIALYCNGGLFTIFPVLVMESFGQKKGGEIYGFIFWGFILANLLQFLIIFGLQNLIGYKSIFMIFLAFTAIAAILLFIYAKRVENRKKLRNFEGNSTQYQKLQNE